MSDFPTMWQNSHLSCPGGKGSSALSEASLATVEPGVLLLVAVRVLLAGGQDGVVGCFSLPYSSGTKERWPFCCRICIKNNDVYTVHVV